MGLWEDFNNLVNPLARDFIPGFAGLEDLAQAAGLTAPAMNEWGGPLMSSGVEVAQAPTSALMTRPAVSRLPMVGGLMNSLMPVPTGGFGRGLIPFTGAYVPGHRVVYRPAFRGSAPRPEGYYLARTRRMNPLNPRALLRAERRMSSFSTWVHRHFRIQKSMPKRKHRGPSRRRK